MKKKITRLFRLLLPLLTFTINAIAQNETNTEFITRTNYVFALLEKNRVTNGMLLDRAW